MSGRWGLPDTWTTATLDELGDWFGGGTPNTANSAFWEGGSIPWVSPKDMKSDVIRSTIDKITPEAVNASATKLVPAGAVLMVTRSGILRHSFPVATVEEPVTLNQDVKALSPYSRINSRYVAYALRALSQQVLDQCTKDGTTVQSVEFGLLKRLAIPVAPTDQQERIVAKLDELFSDIEAGEKALERARLLVQRYRQSVLKAAVTGELTREWRAKNLARLQAEKKTGADLLAEILRKRREAWEAAELAKMRAKGKEPRDEKWKARYQEPAAPDTSKLSKLPEGWVWVSMEMLQAGSPTNGISVKGTDAPPGIPALRLDAIRDGNFDYSRHRYILIDASTVARLAVREGDFFISRANGSKSIMGRAVLAHTPPQQIVFPDTIIRYRLLSLNSLAE